MKIIETGAGLIILLMIFGSAIASEPHEYRIADRSPEQKHRYISLACNNGNVRFSIQWGTRIGEAGKYKRHLVLPGNLGDTHILLRVLKNRTSTGIIDNDQQAKALIKLILKNIGTEGMFIEVFPEGRDPLNGEWEDSVFDYNEFLNGVKAVAKECKWDIQKSITTKVRTVHPGAPYDNE